MPSTTIRHESAEDRAAEERPEERDVALTETDKIWMNGELVDWADAKIHVATHGLHYGTGVFEGMRCYETERGPAVCRLPAHTRGLLKSSKLLDMELPYTLEELDAAVLDTVAANGLSECY